MEINLLIERLLNDISSNKCCQIKSGNVTNKNSKKRNRKNFHNVCKHGKKLNFCLICDGCIHNKLTEACNECLLIGLPEYYNDFKKFSDITYKYCLHNSIECFCILCNPRLITKIEKLSCIHGIVRTFCTECEFL